MDITEQSATQTVMDSLADADGGSGEAQVESESELRLDQAEARVLGSLMEKQLTVPDTYPLTQNSLVLACNQKSSREPPMNLAHGEVGQAVKRLMEHGLADVEYGERVDRYRHLFRQYYSLERAHQALMCVLLLRGAQTVNELKTRTQRMYGFENAVAVKQTLETLTDRDQPLVQCLPKGSGRREDRYCHTLFGAVSVAVELTTTKQGLEQRVEALEALVDRLQHRLEALEGEQF